MNNITRQAINEANRNHLATLKESLERRMSVPVPMEMINCYGNSKLKPITYDELPDTHASRRVRASQFISRLTPHRDLVRFDAVVAVIGDDIF